ncbi:hypothetical protein BGX33_012196 [Mortierella sp. NVP41]|nr:hypothetical protein BGX33_012196 [Mortierella sp. NVP41]
MSATPLGIAAVASAAATAGMIAAILRAASVEVDSTPVRNPKPAGPISKAPLETTLSVYVAAKQDPQRQRNSATVQTHSDDNEAEDVDEEEVFEGSFESFLAPLETIPVTDAAHDQDSQLPNASTATQSPAIDATLSYGQHRQDVSAMTQPPRIGADLGQGPQLQNASTMTQSSNTETVPDHNAQLRDASTMTQTQDRCQEKEHGVGLARYRANKPSMPSNPRLVERSTMTESRDMVLNSIPTPTLTPTPTHTPTLTPIDQSSLTINTAVNDRSRVPEPDIMQTLDEIKSALTTMNNQYKVDRIRDYAGICGGGTSEDG